MRDSIEFRKNENGSKKRMKILGIHEPTIAQFIEEGKLVFRENHI